MSYHQQPPAGASINTPDAAPQQQQLRSSTHGEIELCGGHRTLAGRQGRTGRHSNLSTALGEEHSYTEATCFAACWLGWLRRSSLFLLFLRRRARSHGGFSSIPSDERSHSSEQHDEAARQKSRGRNRAAAAALSPRLTVHLPFPSPDRLDERTRQLPCFLERASACSPPGRATPPDTPKSTALSSRAGPTVYEALASSLLSM